MKRADAIDLIAAERIRQVEVEGWDAAHDDGHGDGSLLTVAVFYLQNAGGHKYLGHTIPIELDERGVPVGFPWDAEWWKPKTPLRDLVRAGALCIAERERRQRKSLTPNLAPVDHKFERIVAALMALETTSPAREG